jgi:hypothetical protein
MTLVELNAITLAHGIERVEDELDRLAPDDPLWAELDRLEQEESQ